MKSSEWTPLTLEGPIVNGSLEGLIGIEELTEYNSNTVIKAKVSIWLLLIFYNQCLFYIYIIF